MDWFDALAGSEPVSVQDASLTVYVRRILLKALQSKGIERYFGDARIQYLSSFR